MEVRKLCWLKVWGIRRVGMEDIRRMGKGRKGKMMYLWLIDDWIFG